jgi:hypothetical protein
MRHVAMTVAGRDDHLDDQEPPGADIALRQLRRS